MAAPVCIQNNILVEIDKAFQDEIVLDSGVRFYLDNTYRPEWNVAVEGKVVSVPSQLTIGNGGVHSLDFDRPKIEQVVSVGDRIVFSYMVVMNRLMDENKGEIFEREKPTNPFITEWKNPNGLKIIREYKMNNKYECALVDTKSGFCIDLVSGGSEDVESFMGRYMPSQSIGFNYRNLLQYDNKDYWKVDYSNAIAIKRGNGHYEMIGEYVMLEPIREPVRNTYEGLIEVYEIAQDTDYRAIGKVVSIGAPLKGKKKLSVKPNDTIVTDIRFVEKYSIDGKDHWIVKQKYIYGKSVIDDTTRNT